MAERRLGGPNLRGKSAPDTPGPRLTPDAPAPKLAGKLKPYVPRGAQYDYKPPSVFARYKILTAVFVVLFVSLFGYWALILRPPRPAPSAALPASAPPPASAPASGPAPARQRGPAPASDPVYIEPLAPR